MRDPYAPLKLIARLITALPPLPLPRWFVNLIVSAGPTPMKVRWLVLVLWGVDTKSWMVSERCYFGGRNITIGRDCGLNIGALFDNTAPIVLGDSVRFGPNVSLITSDHELAGPDCRCGKTLLPKPITIEDGVWLTANVTVGPGVTIGAGSVVAMGSVVTRDLPPNGLYGGVPAKLLRRFDDVEEPALPPSAG